MTKARTIACIGTSYVLKIVGAGLVLFGIGETFNVLEMWLQAKRET